MSLSIIIVNYKTPALLSECLSSIYEQTVDIEFEIIVVDNASGDDSERLIPARFPKVKWIQLDYNAGFARANNKGIRNSCGDTVLLLNSDTVNQANAIGECYKVFKMSEYIACGVQLVNSDGTPQISGNFFVTGGLNNLLPLPYVGAFIKWIGGIFKVRKPHVPDSNIPVEVDWINGAFLMVKKNAIDRVGLMDEDFFLYAEEAEWCFRLGKAGKKVIFGQFKVVHLQGETSNTAFKSSGKGYYNLYDKKGLQIMLSNFVRIRKQYGPEWFLFHLLSYTFTIVIFFILSFISCLLLIKNSADEMKKSAGFTLNVCKAWKFVVIIIRNKPFFYKIL